MEHFLTTEDWSRDDLQGLIDHARIFRDESPYGDALKGKSVALVFFNNSLRTRSSFDIGVNQLGGHAVVLDPGGMWPMEVIDGAVMDGDAEEHIKEAARVLSSYCDLICIRTFPKFQDWQAERKDPLFNAFVRYATAPVINMETIIHPCQELALMMALQDNLGKPDNKKFVLTWTYHPKPLNTAVANSALLIASRFNMDVTLLCPTEDYILDERFMNAARENVKTGGSVTVTHDIDSAYDGADFVYAKSWGAIPFYGNWEAEKPIRDQYKHFIVDEDKMARTNDAYFSHCLPMRRNVKVTDAVADSDKSLIIEEAANRLHVQKAIMARLMKGA